jgi:hypothetical protein
MSQLTTSRRAVVTICMSDPPDAPDEAALPDDGELWLCPFLRSRPDTDPAARVLFVSGCLLQFYCHNPDTWHLKDELRPCPVGDRSVALLPCVAIARRRPDHLGR